MRIFFLSVFVFLGLQSSLFAQVTSTFEEFGLSPGQYLNQAQGGEFTSGSIAFPNYWDTEFEYWADWAISADTNTTTPGFTNQYSAITGGGVDGSVSYGLAYSSTGLTLRTIGLARGAEVLGMYVTNNAYAYYSMKDGDPFSKKFGGESGNDPDFFKLTIKKYLNGELSTDSVDVYLADFRFEDNSQDFILDTWQYVDLKSLGGVDSLYFVLSSSDNGIFGMNTPAFFCADNITTELLSVNKDPMLKEFNIHENPVSSNLRFSGVIENETVSIFDYSGRVVWRGVSREGMNEIDIENFAPGYYILRVGGYKPSRLIKN